MSLSKDTPMAPAGAEKPLLPRQPKCTRCRHHGIIVPQKGHLKFCPYLTCDCWRCHLITQRTRIAALQRSMKKAQNKERRPSEHHTEVSGVRPASAPDGDPRPSATSGLMRPPSEGPLERDACSVWSPLDLLGRPAAGREAVDGVDSGKVLPFASIEEGSYFKAPHFGELGQTAPPLPVIHSPFRMPDPFNSSSPNYLVNMPWWPSMSAGLYNSLCVPLMFPYYQSGAGRYPPLPEPEYQADFFAFRSSRVSDMFQRSVERNAEELE